MDTAAAQLPDVVRLQPVAALTGVDGAPTVAPGHEAAQRLRDGLCGVGCDDGPTLA